MKNILNYHKNVYFKNLIKSILYSIRGISGLKGKLYFSTINSKISNKSVNPIKIALPSLESRYFKYKNVEYSKVYAR